MRKQFPATCLEAQLLFCRPQHLLHPLGPPLELCLLEHLRHSPPETTEQEEGLVLKFKDLNNSNLFSKRSFWGKCVAEQRLSLELADVPNVID